MLLENREKNIRFQKLPDKCGQGLILVAKKNTVKQPKHAIEYISWVKSITFFRNQTPYPRSSPLSLVSKLSVKPHGPYVRKGSKK